MDKKGFTIIELIAVLVILATIVFITAPLVLKIVYDAEYRADERSVDYYGKSIEIAISDYLLEHGQSPQKISDLKINYSGYKVECSKEILTKSLKIYLTQCKVNGRDVEDYSNEDGWYHYGEVAYLDYKIGDTVIYNDMKFYVIKDSNESEKTLILLKDEPLSVEEVNTYGGVGTNKNYINNYCNYCTRNTAYNKNGYGGMLYYSTEGCRMNGNDHITGGCTNDYEKSHIKYVVDAWALDKLNFDDLIEDEDGYTARLLTSNDLMENLGYSELTGTVGPSSNGTTPTWVYSTNYGYWAINNYYDSNSSAYYVMPYGGVMSEPIYFAYSAVVRPVIILSKEAI